MSKQAGLGSNTPGPAAGVNTVSEFGAALSRSGGSRWIVALTGEVDMYTAPAVERELQNAIDAGGQEVVVDLSETTFIDSTFLGVLIAAHKQLEQRGGRIAIVCADRNLLKLFEITGLDTVFAIHSALATEGRQGQQHDHARASPENRRPASVDPTEDKGGVQARLSKPRGSAVISDLLSPWLR